MTSSKSLLAALVVLAAQCSLAAAQFGYGGYGPRAFGYCRSGVRFGRTGTGRTGTRPDGSSGPVLGGRPSDDGVPGSYRYRVRVSGFFRF
uniref:Putative glycine rich protein n=1 Tax=Ixodes ricinus TaxID=34613 RepID=A0A0K8RDY8_IXORI